MKPLARYHLIWAIVLVVVTCLSLGITVRAWLAEGRPPIYHFWAEQMIIVAGGYLTWARIKAFNKSRKS